MAMLVELDYLLELTLRVGQIEQQFGGINAGKGAVGRKGGHGELPMSNDIPLANLNHAAASRQALP